MSADSELAAYELDSRELAQAIAFAVAHAHHRDLIGDLSCTVTIAIALEGGGVLVLRPENLRARVEVFRVDEGVTRG